MAQIPSFYDESNKVWSGAERFTAYNPNLSIGQLINMQLKNWPKNVAQINDVDGSVLTNADVLKFSVQIAQQFKKMKLCSDDVIGLIATNSTYVVSVANACFFNTTPLHVVNPTLEGDSVTHLFNVTKPKLIFSDGALYDKVYNATKHFNPVIYTLLDHVEGVPKVEELLQPSPTDTFYMPQALTQGPDQTMAILCSSGTTGLPKAVCFSNESLKNIPNGIWNGEDVIFSFSTLDWYTGFLNYLISMILGATRVITNRSFDVKTFVDVIEKYEVTWTVIPPRHMTSLLSSPYATPEKLKSIRFLTCLGAAISMRTMEKAQALFKSAVFSFTYGVTEFGGIALNLGLDHGTSVGKLFAGLKARIVDDEGKNLGPNEVGEILLHRSFKWPGYYGNLIETKKTIDDLGWLHTGDLGYFDDNHFMYILDRKKNVLKYRGMQYWTPEIEEVVQKMPGVLDACVFGIYNEENGDEAGALIVLEKRVKLSENDVKSYVAKELPDKHKHLHAGVVFVDHLPQNENGKVLKKQAKEIFINLASI